MHDTTEDSPREGIASAAGELTQPSLILAFAEEGSRQPELRWLPPSGVILGRGARLFEGGPLVDSKLSREHAALRRRPGGDGWEISDLNSRNGTWVDGQRVEQPRELNHGSVIRTGDTLLVFARCPLAPPSGGPAGPVGISAALQAVRRSIELVAREMTSVLVLGETGTGKELVARALHERSGRQGALVSLNCGAIAEGVLASELFGHARGAFTGATGARDGLFRAAEGGTLFLDEVGETPLALQVQLLRALETRTIRPMGSARDVPVDVRIVAATNRDLTESVRAGTFRTDLFARLSPWQIRTPPLRERREDLPWLWGSLLARRGPPRRMTIELAEALLLHDWPFNVRGLLNALTVADIASPPGEPLGLHPQVAASLAADRAIAAPPAASSRAAATGSKPAPSAEVLRGALQRSRGRIAEAARELGCTRQQLYRWASAHAIDVGEFR
jgi:DNA-binding NtrC family response regulator